MRTFVEGVLFFNEHSVVCDKKKQILGENQQRKGNKKVVPLSWHDLLLTNYNPMNIFLSAFLLYYKYVKISGKVARDPVFRASQDFFNQTLGQKNKSHHFCDTTYCFNYNPMNLIRT